MIINGSVNADIDLFDYGFHQTVQDLVHGHHYHDHDDESVDVSKSSAFGVFFQHVVLLLLLVTQCLDQIGDQNHFVAVGQIGVGWVAVVVAIVVAVSMFYHSSTHIPIGGKRFDSLSNAM